MARHVTGAQWGLSCSTIGISAAVTTLQLPRVALVCLLLAACEATMLTDRCQDDHRIVTDAARNGTIWALRVMDSWGQFPVSGLLEGNTALLGSFDECLDSSGKYCLATVRLPQQVPRRGSADDAWQLLPASGSSLRWAVCVPQSCSESDAGLLLRGRLQALLPGRDADIEVREDSCSVPGSPPLSPNEWAFLTIMGLICVIIVVSTAYDCTLAEQHGLRKDSARLAFSARRNWRALTAISRAGFTSLHGLKFLSMAWVLLFHTNSVVVDTPAANSESTLPAMMYDWTRIPIANGGNLAVNTFIVASGLLLSFTFLRERSQGRPFSLAGFYLHRYLRLTPAYVAVIWLYATVLPRLGSGPRWPEVAGVVSQRCHHSWWLHLLYVNNYQRMQDTCMGQSWYLATDMQLYWASPLLLWPIHRWPTAARGIVTAVILAATAAVFAVTFAYNLPWADIHGMTEDEFTRYLAMMYLPAYSRIVPYVTGIVLGWVLFSSRDKKWKMSKVCVAGCWAASAGLALGSVYGLHASYHLPYHRLEAAVFASLRPIAWSLSVAWVIYACEKGHAGPVKAILSWPGFQPLAKLCYGAYLVQYLILFYDQGETRTPIVYGSYYVVHKMLGDSLLVLPLAAVLFLSFEMPALNLDKALLNPGSKPTTACNVVSRDNLAFVTTEQQTAVVQLELDTKADDNSQLQR